LRRKHLVAHWFAPLHPILPSSILPDLATPLM
jgi:hypothetical protein